VVEADHLAAAVKQNPNRVKAHIQGMRPLLDFAEECRGESSDLLTLMGMQAFPRRVEVAGSSRFDLNEDER